MHETWLARIERCGLAIAATGVLLLFGAALFGSPVAWAEDAQGMSITSSQESNKESESVAVSSSSLSEEQVEPVTEGGAMPGEATADDGLTDGKEYVIESAIDNSKVLDVYGGSVSDGGNVQIFSSNDTPAQKWQLSHDDQGNVTITNVKSSKCLDVTGGVSASGTNVQQCSPNGTDAQKWKIVRNSDNSYSIVSSLNNSLALDLYGGSSANGANVQIWSLNGSAAQRWFFFDAVAYRKAIDDIAESNKGTLAAGEYVISSAVNARQVIEIPGGSLDNAAGIKLFESNMTNAQAWKISVDSLGYAEIVNVKSGKSLDVYGGNAVNAGMVEQYTANGSWAQRWIICKNSDGTYCIVSALDSTKVLDVRGGDASNGAIVQLFEANGTLAQRWLLLALSPSVKLSEAANVTSGAWYRIASADSLSEVLDIYGGSHENGGNARMFESNGSYAQLFQIAETAPGVYSLINANSNMAIDIEGGNVVPGTNVQQYSYSQSNVSQQFNIVENTDGTFTFISIKTGLVLAIDEITGNVAMALPNSSDRKQRFALEKVQTLIDDGVYILKSALPGEKAVSVRGASTDDGATVQLSEYRGRPADKWMFAKVSGGEYSYTIQSLGSGKYLTEGANSTLVQSASTPEHAGQIWAVSISFGHFVITSRATSLVFDVYGGNTADGTLVRVFAKNDTVAQEFILSATKVLEDGTYELRNAENLDRALDVTGASVEPGANVQVITSNGTAAQQWTVTSSSDGLSAIRSTVSGKTLDVYGGNISDGVNVQQWTDNGTPAQRWEISWNRNGYYVIKSALNPGYVLEASDDNGTNNSNAQIYSYSPNELRQGWLFVSVAASRFYLYLDAGHVTGASGYDPGASGNGYTEAELTSELVNKIAKLLGEQGVRVHTSLEDSLNYTERQAKAQQLGCTTLISIHFNSADSASAHGTESYVSEHYAAEGSIYLQQIIHQYLIQGTGLTDRGMKAQDFSVIHGGLPAVLLEVAFVTSSSDMSTYQQRKDLVARDIAAGILEYSSKVFGSSSSSGADSGKDVVDNSIMGVTQTNVEKMVSMFAKSGKTYPASVFERYGASTISDFCQIVVAEANAEGVRAEVVFSQAMLETGWLQFGNQVKASQCNFCGLGATDDGAAGADFSSYGENAVRMGIRAQVQHLKAYGSTDPLNNVCVDPRFDYVSRGCAPTVSGLSKHWASSDSYGEQINTLIKQLLR